MVRRTPQRQKLQSPQSQSSARHRCHSRTARALSAATARIRKTISRSAPHIQQTDTAMKESYHPGLKAHLLTDDGNRVLSIRHTHEYWESPTQAALASATAYLREFAGVYQLEPRALARL